MTTTEQRVLVTGGSGFIAGHCVLQLLERGLRVRTTVRSLKKEDTVRAILTDAGMTDGDALSFAEADLLDDAGWAEAVDGCDFVLHVASPVKPGPVENEDDLIVPAREGTLRVLRAARAAGVRRVVLTSAFHAVGFGHPRGDHTFTEADWSVLDGPGMDAYGKSKVLAEKAAWDFAAQGAPELVTILPVAVMGKIMGTEISGSNHIVRNLLSGRMPGIPDMYIPIVDVRDVAAAHVAAMTAEGAAGERFLVAGEPGLAMREIARILREHLGDAAAGVPAQALDAPGPVGLDYVKNISGEKAARVLGLRPRPAEEAIVAAGESISNGAR